MAGTASSPSAQTLRLKACPRCGRTSDASRNRCVHCWADLKGVAVLSPADAERRRAAEGDDADRAAIAAGSRRRTRLLQLALLLGVLVLGGWWVYQTFFYTPPPPGTPSSTARNIDAGPSSWPVNGGTLGGTRATTAGAHLDGEVAWSVDLGATFATAVVASEDTVFATLTDARLVALNAEDGSERWSVELEARPLAGPTIAGDRVYIAQPGGVLTAIDATTGDEVWEVGPIGTTFGTSPLVVGGVVYAFGIGHMYGFDAETGEQLWSHEVDTRWAFVTPVAEGDFLAVATGNRTLVFNRLEGQRTFFYEFERAHPYSIVADQGEVYTVSERFAASLRLDSVRPWWEGVRAVWTQFWIWGMAPDVPPPPANWTAPDPPGSGYPAALSDERLFVAGEEGRVEAFVRSDGERAWTVQLDPIVAPPVLTGDGLLVVRERGLSLLDPADGSVESERALETAALRGATVTAHGTYLVDASGGMHALR